jgi:hypothetical protein
MPTTYSENVESIEDSVRMAVFDEYTARVSEGCRFWPALCHRLLGRGFDSPLSVSAKDTSLLFPEFEE